MTQRQVCYQLQPQLKLAVLFRACSRIYGCVHLLAASSQELAVAGAMACGINSTLWLAALLAEMACICKCGFCIVVDDSGAAAVVLLFGCRVLGRASGVSIGRGWVWGL
jgi:hypothetical protein